MNIEKILEARISRRGLGILALATAGAALLSGCDTKYVNRQTDHYKRVATLVLPNGENYPEVGSCSMYLPPDYLFLTKNPLSRAAITDGRTYSIALAIESDSTITTVRLGGAIRILSLGYQEWGYSSPIGNPKKEHLYLIQWDKIGIQEISWDGNILNQIPVPTSTTIQFASSSLAPPALPWASGPNTNI